MTIRVGINGLGRIGRAFLRHTSTSDDLEIVAANDLIDSSAIARLLRHDSTFGPFGHGVDAEPGLLVVNGHKIPLYAEAEPGSIPWGDHDVDVVVEATGRHRTRLASEHHLSAGARRVLLSAPGEGVDFTVVMGVNDADFRPSDHWVVSNASCTTNCAAPMVKVLHEAFGIEHGFMTTVHAYTNDQNLLDAPHSDPRRARAAGVNIVPTSTGAARAIGHVLPELAGRLDGVALRVPVIDGSLVDLGVIVRCVVTADEVNEVFRLASTAGALTGRLRYETEPLVSSDVIGDSASCIFDPALTQAAGSFVKVLGWYDNEWGYTCRLAEATRMLGH